MAKAAESPYGTYGSVSTVSPEGGGGDPMGVRATGADFGAQVGTSLEQAGATGEKLGTETTALGAQYAQEATHAKVDDTYANQYMPAAAKLRQQFDQLRGVDKVSGYDGYVSNLQQMREQMLGGTQSPYERQLLSATINRHITQEVDGASREIAPALNQYQDQTQADRILAESNNAVSNYNNPQVVKQSEEAIDGVLELRGIDRGMPPEAIDEQQRQAKSVMYTGMVGRALESGDINTANMIYANSQTTIPGYQQLEIEKTLHSENIRQTGAQGSDALLAGKPLPPAVGYHPPEVQASVVNAAQTSGVDPNQALAVARLESNYGQNVGTRGDIGQTGKGGDLQEQSANLCAALKHANEVATKQLGRPAEPWESYAVYQQGEGGGPALMLAAQRDPTARAVDTLAPLYENPKTALSAVVNNGGNASMTAGQFLDLIKEKYNANAQRVACDFPNGGVAPVPNPANPTVLGQVTPPTLGDAIMAPHQQNGIPLQPAATPVQALSNFDKVFPDALMRANQIPNLAQREGVIKALEQKRSVYVAGAAAWKQQFQNQAGQLAIDPNFTSTDQIPPSMKAALVDSPDTLKYLEHAAETNLQRSTGAVTKDQKEYGGGFYKLFQGIHAAPGDPDRVTDITQLQSHIGEKGDITMAGYDKLVKEMQGKNTPDGEAEAKMREQTFKVVKGMVSGADEGIGLKDPKGEEIFAHAQPLIYKAIEDGKASGVPIHELYDPQSPKWVGNVAKGLKRSVDQQTADMMRDHASITGTQTPGVRDLASIIRDVQSGKLTEEQGRSEATSRGLAVAKTTKPEVPEAM